MLGMGKSRSEVVVDCGSKHALRNLPPFFSPPHTLWLSNLVWVQGDHGRESIGLGNLQVLLTHVNMNIYFVPFTGLDTHGYPNPCCHTFLRRLCRVPPMYVEEISSSLPDLIIPSSCVSRQPQGWMTGVEWVAGPLWSTAVPAKKDRRRYLGQWRSTC